MPATLLVNARTVVHRTSDGIALAFPDVCLTSTPGGPVPIPYPNLSRSADAAGGAVTVTVDGNPLVLEDTDFALSSGDEAGALGNVITGKVKGPARFILWSFDVTVEGKGVPRQLDLMMHNHANISGTPPFPCLQPGGVAPPLTGEEIPEEEDDVVEVVRNLRLPILDRYRRPLADVRYTLRIGDVERQGVTDADGILLERDVPRGPVSLRLEDGRLALISRTGRVPIRDAPPFHLYLQDRTLTPPPNESDDGEGEE